MHQIRLYQSTWADAQRLMHRWGAWGHYDGSCTAADCEYDNRDGRIPCYSNPCIPSHAWLDWLFDARPIQSLSMVRRTRRQGSLPPSRFTMEPSGETGTGISINVPTRRMRKDNDCRLDSLYWCRELPASSSDTRRTRFLWMGGAEGLAQHPYYKVGRPSGCKILCQIVNVYYSTHTPPAEIERLTSYNFSCFTRFNPCIHRLQICCLHPESGTSMTTNTNPAPLCLCRNNVP